LDGGIPGSGKKGYLPPALRTGHRGGGKGNMRVIRSEHREADGTVTVSLLFKAREQLLDPDDPSSPPEQELTDDAEAAIITSFDTVPMKKPVALEIRIPDSPDFSFSAAIPDAIRHHFRYLLAEHEKEWKIFLRGRRASLAFAVFNIFLAFIYIVTLYENEAWISTFAGIVTGGIIVILNWATIWDTYEFFVYDGLERRHREKLLLKIIGSDIRVSPA
jgi:hypothetical protein